MATDFVIVGSGLTGSVVARTLHDAGFSVVVLERRSHIGGNVHDYLHESGVRLNTYGPHYFRTNSDKIWSFVNRFSRFRVYEACIKTLVDGRYENWPIAGSYIRRVAGENWKLDLCGHQNNFEGASLALMPKIVYERTVKGYTEKQWGVPASTLSASLVKRFDVREDDDPRLMRHKYQGLPEEGYDAFMKAMLQGIKVVTNCNYLNCREEWPAEKMVVFTGPVDEYFGFELGKLKYRAQARHHEYLPSVALAQPCVQVNNPDPNAGEHIRTIEWKHMMAPDDSRRTSGTVLTREIPYTPSDSNDYEYPFPDEINASLYKAYALRAKTIPKLTICGRLGEYRYYDMDQAIARAQVISQRILNAPNEAVPSPP